MLLNKLLSTWILLAVMTQTFIASGSEPLFGVSEYEKASSGSSIHLKINNAKDVMSILKKHKVTIFNLPKKEILLLSNVINNLDELTASNFAKIDGTRVRYVESLTNVYARQTQGPIDIGPHAIQNYSVYTHELGHVVGNHSLGKSNYYALYNRAVKTPCHFTQYSSVSHGHGARNEEFAEVFAAFALAPELLHHVSAGCNDAFDFMKNEIFIEK